MDHMSALDSTFLHAEDGITHMHIGSCAIFEGPQPSFDEVLALIAGKLPRIPRYRQKVRFVPGGIGLPVWVDDGSFELAYHVRHTALPAPASRADLDTLIGRLMSAELDRDRPLWEVWMIDGLPDGRWRSCSRSHDLHAEVPSSGESSRQRKGPVAGGELVGDDDEVLELHRGQAGVTWGWKWPSTVNPSPEPIPG
jgi:Wax ester synthase-like Acyl-CoA acyltransferase domain